MRTRHQRLSAGTLRDGSPLHLEVTEVGADGDPAVVLAHGVGSSARFVVEACAGPVVASGRRLVTYDARGHGASSPCRAPADHELDAYTADLAAVAGTAGALAAVGGISLGGHAAIRWRGTVPRVVCLPAWSGRAVRGRGPHAYLAAEVRATGVVALTDRLRADTSLRPWLRRTLLTDYPRHDRDSLAAALTALDGAEAPDDAEVAALPVPVAVVGWRGDPGHPFELARHLAAVAPGGTFTELALADLDVALTRLGDAVVAALGSLDQPRAPVR